MAGIYIHIPFCKKKCGYCDFYSVTQLTHKSPFIQALLKEIESHKTYFANTQVETIYFGGGTPSLLSASELDEILQTIHKHYSVQENAEITLEVNPDDLNQDSTKAYTTMGINRISMGVQSFNDTDLLRMDRRHTAKEALQAIEYINTGGIENYSIDLMYGLHLQTPEMWEHNLNIAFELAPQHLSCYHLTYEPGTQFYKRLKRGELQKPSENASESFIKVLHNLATNSGYDHYEISNLAKDGKYSKHNTAYWNGKPYLGFGSSAHSYIHPKRWWNASSLSKYIQTVNQSQDQREVETLNKTVHYNEFIITRLRTKWGINLAELENTFGLGGYFKQNIQKWIDGKYVLFFEDNYRLNVEGWLISDQIFVDLMLDE